LAKRAKKKTAAKTPQKAAGREPRTPGRLEAEAIALGLLALALFTEVALWSYSPADPWWGFGARVHNACGPVGALIARALAGALGFAGHVLPAAAVLISVRYLRGRPVRPRWIPGVAWGVFWISLAASFAAAARAFPQWLPAHAGGAIGDGLVAGLESALYLPGSAVLLSITALVSFLVATDVSIRETAASLRRSGRVVGRGLSQLVVVSGVRLRRRLAQVSWPRREAGESEDLSALPSPAEVVRRVTGRIEHGAEPEVVEHRVEKQPVPRQQALPLGGAGEGDSSGPFQLPGLDLLARGAEGDRGVDRDRLIKNSRILEKKLADFGVKGRVVKVHPGPVITMYEFEPAPGIKVSRIVNLADDLALALRAMSVRIVAPIPGKSVVGVEVPDPDREVVVLHDLFAHEAFQSDEGALPIALGKDIFGTPIMMDLAKMPHLLVAGATGAGKSVFLNALLCSLFYKSTPAQVKLLLIDPKMLEFSVFKGIPHLLAEVVTNPKRASAALMGVVHKMEERYVLMSELGVRNIDQYNRTVARERAHGKKPEPDRPLDPLPYIVVVIDELADLMIVAARDVEESLMRLAQMARAAGIHLVLATQRPSVDVLTGIIKANFPARIAFQVASRTDSRTVLDANGAERLLGQGDMLFLPPTSSQLQRIHGPYVSDKDVEKVVEFLQGQGQPEFDPDIIRLKEESDKREERGGDYDELFDEAVDIVGRHRIASISFIQRKLKIGYNRSARLVEQMQDEGIVGPQEGTKPREIFVRPPDD